MGRKQHPKGTLEEPTATAPVTQSMQPAAAGQAPLPKQTRSLSGADYAWALLTALAALAVYVSCLCPTVSGEDAGELVTAAYTLGVAHPPGYPLWCLLAKVFTYIPYGSIAWRVGLMSAFFGSASVFLLCLLLIKLTGRRLAAIASALAFAFSGEFWEQSTIPEVYSLNLFFIVLSVLLLYTWYEKRQDWLLFPFALGYGMSLANHNTMLLLGPVFVLFVIVIDPFFFRRWRLYLACTLTALAGTLFYLYLPIRSLANPPVDWGNPEDWERFWAVVTRQQYALGFQEHPLTFSNYLGQVWAFLKLYAWEFGPWIAWVPIVGACLLYLRDRYAFLLMASAAWVTSFGFILVLNFEIDRQSLWLNNVFWIPAYMTGAVGIGICLAWLQDHRLAHRSAPLLLPACCCGVVASPLLLHYTQNDRSDYSYAADFGKNVLATLPENAIYFPTADHATFPVLYLQAVEGMRPDVLLANKYGYPEESIYEDMPERTRSSFGQIPNQGQERSIEDWVVRHSQRPVYFTKRRDMGGLPGHRLVTAGLLYRVLRPGEEEQEVDYWSQYRWRTTDPAATKGELTADYILADYYFMRAVDYLASGERGKAVDALRISLDTGGETKEALNNVGSACAEYGLLEQAQDHLERTLALDPTYVMAQRNLAKVYLQLGEEEKALLRFEDILREAPADVEAVRLSAQCLKAIGWFDEAIARYEYLAQLTPRDPQVFRELGYLYLEHKKQPHRAMPHFSHSLELDPDQPELMRLLTQAQQPEQPTLDNYALPEAPLPTLPDLAPRLPQLPAQPSVGISTIP